MSGSCYDTVNLALYQEASTRQRKQNNRKMDDVTRCPVCFEDYGDSEHLLPLLLPCTHTFCSTCIELLMRNSKLVCPLDQREHDVEQGVITFAQNRYI